MKFEPPKRKPEFENLLQVLRCKKPERPTLFEFFLNARLYEFLAGRPYREGASYAENAVVTIEAFKNAGYDYVTLHACIGFGFPNKGNARDHTISLNDGFVITDRKSFEDYAWMDPAQGDNSHFESLRKHLPDGMKAMVAGPGGVLENVISLVGYDNLC